MGPESQSKDLGLADVLDRVTLVIMRILSLISKGNDLAKRIRLLWSAIYQVNLRLEVVESAC